MGVGSTAKANVHTKKGGSGTINLEAHVSTSQASSKVHVTVTSGSASAQVSAHEPPRKKLTPRRPKEIPQLPSSSAI